MKSVIVEALDEVCQGYSPDRVVADPELNSQFVAARRKRGLADNVAELNRALFNLRKRRELRGRPRATRTSFADQTNYQFAAEMAIRFIERRDSVSLDDVICDPSVDGGPKLRRGAAESYSAGWGRVSVVNRVSRVK